MSKSLINSSEKILGETTPPESTPISGVLFIISDSEVLKLVIKITATIHPYLSLNYSQVLVTSCVSS